jgi:hypothetical protein
MSWFANVRGVAIYLLVLVVSAWGLRAAAPFPDIPQVRAKLDALAAEKRCDVLFLGSSKIYHGVIPRQFDAAMKAHGVSVRSFNLGVDGMGFPETAYFCEQALQRRGSRRVRWIFIEAAGIRTAIPAAQRGTRRIVYWHDFERTRTVARALLADLAHGAPSAEEDRDLLLEHLALWWRRMSNIGEASEWMNALATGPLPPGPHDIFSRKDRGYSPIKGRMPERDFAKLRADLGTPRAAMSPKLAAVTDDVFRRFSKRMARSGATVIYVVPPNPKAHEPIFGSAAETPPFISFDDAQQYPEFYIPEHRSDYAHLNHQGAELFTKVLADRFAAYLTSHAEP